MKATIIILAGLLVLVSGCSAEQATQVTVDRQQAVYNQNQPIHTYDRSNEREIVQQLYDFRIEKNVNTWTVWVSMTGEPMGMCASKGFGIPYNTSLTNPLQTIYSAGAVIAQAEPTGLFPGGSTSATWILCLEEDGSIYPQYIEPDVMTFTWPVKIVTIKDGRRQIERVEVVPDPTNRVTLGK